MLVKDSEQLHWWRVLRSVMENVKAVDGSRVRLRLINDVDQAGRIDLEVFALDDALRLPGLALLDIYFLHPAFGQDIVSRITDILRNGVVQEGLAHLPDDVLLRSAHAYSPRPGFLRGLR